MPHAAESANATTAAMYTPKPQQNKPGHLPKRPTIATTPVAQNRMTHMRQLGQPDPKRSLAGGVKAGELLGLIDLIDAS